jgi:Protein of unknown function (DUF2911)
MKTAFLFFSGLCLTFWSAAQDSLRVPPLDKSPMDMSYWPDQYPILKFQGKINTPPLARIIYGRPQKDSRVIFGELIRYNELWRLGANEASELEFYQPVKMGGKPIPKGKYTIYCIPTANDWTFILNKDTDSWGAFRYDKKKDVMRVRVQPKKTTTPTEVFSIYFDKTATGANLVVSWDTLSAALPISL